jgi:hypothetical protein
MTRPAAGSLLPLPIMLAAIPCVLIDGAIRIRLPPVRLCRLARAAVGVLVGMRVRVRVLLPVLGLIPARRLISGSMRMIQPVPDAMHERRDHDSPDEHRQRPGRNRPGTHEAAQNSREAIHPVYSSALGLGASQTAEPHAHTGHS